MARGQFVDACFQQEIGVVGRELQSLLISSRCLGGAACLLQQHTLQLDCRLEIGTLLKQAEDKIHCLLPVAVLGEAERLVELPHQGRLDGRAGVLRPDSGSSGSKQHRQKQDSTETICGPGGRLLAQEYNKRPVCVPPAPPASISQ